MKEFKIKAENIKSVTEMKGSCIASDKITVEGQKIGFMYREEPSDVNDTGWRFLAGDETYEYTDNSDNFEIFDINTICNYDDSILRYIYAPIGTTYVKKEGEFKKIDN